MSRAIRNSDFHTAAANPPASQSPNSGKRRCLFGLMAFLLAVVPFVLLELGLRMLGIGAPTVSGDRHAGFGPQKLFEIDHEAHVYRTSLAHTRFFVPQEFPVQKEQDGFRVFCLGGSTVQGRPYRPETAFSSWLELEWDACHPGRSAQVINCGGISYASYRLRPILEEVLEYEPDLIVLATGHNEFLEDRTYGAIKSRSGVRIWIEQSAQSLHTVRWLQQISSGPESLDAPPSSEILPEQVETRLDDSSGYASYHRDEAWRTKVIAEFESSLEEMVQLCDAQEVPMILVQLGANLRDCPPFKSEHKQELSVDDEQQWQMLFDRASEIDATDPDQALANYEQARDIDDQHALLHFRIARCLDRLQQFEAARESYNAALTHDICPLRMLKPVGEIIAATADKYDVPFVDAQALVNEQCLQGIPGYDSYIDHVHPSIEVHQMIARAIAERVAAAGIFNCTNPLTDQRRRHTFRRHLLSLGPVYFSNGRRRIGWLEDWARRQKLFEETLPQDARGFWALGMRSLDLHDFELAGGSLQMALLADDQIELVLLERARRLFQQGRSDAAQWILDRLWDEVPSEQQRIRIELALLILAVDEQNSERVAEIYGKRIGNWDAIFAESAGEWADMMPDVISRAEGLLSQPEPVSND